MVTPITGPFITVKSLPGPITSLGYIPEHYYRWAQSYKQTKPYDRPNAFTVRIYQVTSSWNSSSSAYDSAQAGPTKDANHIANALNKCYGEFVEKARYHSALMATNVLEAGSAMSMITGRLTQLHDFSRAIRRFDFVTAGKILLLPKREMKRILPIVRKRKAAKHYAGNWLEYHFGWEPLLQDIHEALETFVDPYPPGNRVRARGFYSSSGTTVYGSLPKNTDTNTRKSAVQMGAYVEVNNPNTLLMSQMGFVNPLSIAWEAVPFSFVVDWFSNVGQVLGACTDFVGLLIKHSYTTTFQKSTLFRVSGGYYNVWYPGLGKYKYEYVLLKIASWSSVYVDRSTGISGPVLKLKPFKGFSPVRGLTAASLLVQFLQDSSKHSVSRR